MIAVDVGNTTVSLGEFHKGKLHKVHILTQEGLSQKSLQKKFSCFKQNEPAVVCSVVPEANRFFRNLGRRIYLIGKDIKVPIKSLYDSKKVGIDRLVAAYEAKKINPSVRIVLDFGTAITVDFLSESGDYQGGIILPGVNATLKALRQCSLLPKRIKIEQTSCLIPENTSESINKGLEEGFSHMLNGIISKYQDLLKIEEKNKVLITGGDFLRLNLELTFNFCYVKDLVLKGIYSLYQKSKNLNS